jgi:hypothetical protein
MLEDFGEGACSVLASEGENRSKEMTHRIRIQIRVGDILFLSVA